MSEQPGVGFSGLEPKIISIRKITEVTISRIKVEYGAAVQRYLSSLGCIVTPLEERGSYRVQFPEGSTEEVHEGRSTQWAYRTTVRFQSGEKIEKTVFADLQGKGSYTSLAIPISALRMK